MHSVLLDSGAEEVITLSQQQWQVLADLQHKLEMERKRLSIPGSVVEVNNVLFDKADIAVETQQSKLNAAGMDHATGTGMKHFRLSGRSFERRKMKMYSFRGNSYSFRPSYSGGLGGYGAYG